MALTQGHNLAVVIMAAGKGKRMGNPDLAKVLTLLDGKPLLQYVIEQSSSLKPVALVIVVGHQHDAVRAFVSSAYPDATCVLQSEQLGTGHAVQQAKDSVVSKLGSGGDAASNVLILSGDVPLLTSTTLAALLEHHVKSAATLTVLSTTVPNPAGYGRIVRDSGGELQSIVEQKDATSSQAALTEINSGVYVVRTKPLFDALDRVRNANAQNEYYLTDIVGILKSDGARVEAFHTQRWEEVHGINTAADLARATELRHVTIVQEC